MGMRLILMGHINLSPSLNLLHKVKRLLQIFKIIKDKTLFNKLKKNSKAKGSHHSIRCFHHASFQMQVDKRLQFKTLTFTILRL